MSTTITALAAVAALTAPTAAVPPKLTPRIYTITITRPCAQEDVSGPNDAAGCYWSSARGRKYLAWGHVGPKHGTPGTVGEWRIDALIVPAVPKASKCFPIVVRTDGLTAKASSQGHVFASGRVEHRN